MKEYIGYIYLTQDKTNGKIYVGKHHGDFNPKYLGSGAALKKAKKGRCQDFFVDPLCWCRTEEELKEMELMWIQHLGALDPEIGYNDSLVSSPPTNLGKSASDKTRQKMSDNRKGKASWTGLHHKQESKQSMMDSKAILFFMRESIPNYVLNYWFGTWKSPSLRH